MSRRPDKKIMRRGGRLVAGEEHRAVSEQREHLTQLTDEGGGVGQTAGETTELSGTHQDGEEQSSTIRTSGGGEEENECANISRLLGGDRSVGGKGKLFPENTGKPRTDVLTRK